MQGSPPYLYADMDANLKPVDDIHALTGAMKLYLRELPVPLMTFDAYDICLIAARSGYIGQSLDMLSTLYTTHSGIS